MSKCAGRVGVEDGAKPRIPIVSKVRLYVLSRKKRTAVRVKL
jgi:hypothetical protein